MTSKPKALRALLCALILIPSAAAADPAEGYWVSIDEKSGKPSAGWKFYIEDGVLFGKIVSIAGYPRDARAVRCRESYRGFPIGGKVNALRVIGTPWIFGLQRAGEGRWTDGSIVNPEDGLLWKARVTCHPADNKKYRTDTLEVRGEIGLGIGRSQFWPRATQTEAERLGRPD